MNGGIDQLVDTYKVNPNPLQQKVQQAQQQAQQKMLQQGQQGQPSNEIPPDLEEAIALQKIAELHQGAQNQQAMQAGGAQPSVVAKLQQMLGGVRQQAQPQGAPAPQGEPVMAAHGGSIDQLMSNLGRHYAGGGIVAFNGKTDSDVQDEDLKKKLQQYTLQQQGADWVARKEAERLAEAEADARRQALVSQIPTGGQQAPESTGPMPGETERNINNAMAALPGASATKGFAGGMRNLMALIGTLGNRESNVAPTATPQSTDATDAETEKLKRLAAARLQTTQAPPPPTPSAPAAPRPSAVPSAGAPTNANAAAARLDPNGLRALSEKMIREEMGLNPETESDKMVARARKLMGMDEILNEKRARVSDFEKAVEESKANRTPEWIKGLQAAGGAPVRGGLGMLLGRVGSAATNTREAYDSQDLEYKRELNRLRDVISDAQLKGNTELAKEALAAYREVDARRRAGLTSATSLLNTDENVRSREQVAADNRAARAQSASQHAQNQALALEERKRQFEENQLRLIREKDVARANMIENAIAKRTGNIDMLLQNPKIKPEDEASLQARRNAIVKQVMAEYPSVKPEKPSESQFLAAARAANPGVSDAELKAYYKQNYGK